MKAENVTIERNNRGIFATARVFVPLKAKSEIVTIWAKPGHLANDYENFTDSELQQIAAGYWMKLHENL